MFRKIFLFTAVLVQPGFADTNCQSAAEVPGFGAVAAFVERASGVRFEHLPELCVLTEAEMVQASGDQALVTEALYDKTGGRVLVAGEIDLTDPVEASVLVHELVHHAQAISGQDFACPAAAEKEAYDAQEAWLAETGETLESAFGIDKMTRFILTACGI